jgi:acetylglutamate kinase
MKQVIVVKVGGHVLSQPATLAEDLQHLTHAGLNVVVVHGGGHFIDSELNALGIKPTKLNGLRVTDEPTMQVVSKVIAAVNDQLVHKLSDSGVNACAFDPMPGLLQCKKVVELGLVGEVESVDTATLQACFAEGLVPVVAPLGIADDGKTVNINADNAAVAIASALKASKLFFMSDVPGVLAVPTNPESRLSALTVNECQKLLATNVATGGMRPKLQTAMAAIGAGVQSVNIIDGLVPHALWRACISIDNVGTLITQ